MSQRSKGDGSVYRSPDGSGWIVSLDLPRLGNGRRRRRKRRAKTRAEGLRLLKQLRQEFDLTGSVAPANRTMADAVASYLEVRKGSNLSAGARDDDQWHSRLILEGLSRRGVSKLTVAECDEFLHVCSLGLNGRRPIGRDRMNRVRRFLVAVLHNEMRTGGLTRNVASLSVVPENDKEKNEQRALTGDELRTLLEAAKGSRLILIDLCGRNGLRPAEARALRWQDVDLDAQELNVRGQMSRNNERTDTKKAHNSTRTIRIDTVSVDRLKTWREKQDTLRAKADVAWQENDIIASTSFGTPVDRHSFARSIRLLCKRLEIDPPIRPYELRHTAISMQADAGRSAWEISDWAGTSEAMISRTYRHRLRRVSSLIPHA